MFYDSVSRITELVPDLLSFIFFFLCWHYPKFSGDLDTSNRQRGWADIIRTRAFLFFFCAVCLHGCGRISFYCICRITLYFHGFLFESFDFCIILLPSIVTFSPSFFFVWVECIPIGMFVLHILNIIFINLE